MSVKGVGTVRLETQTNIYTNTSNEVSGDEVQNAVVDALDSLAEARWQDDIPYEVGEIKLFDNGTAKELYICVSGTTPGESPSTHPAKWNKIKYIGKTGSFLGSELSSNQITITHNLGIEYVFVILYDKDDKKIADANFEVTTIDENSFTLTLNQPIGGSDTVTYRIL